MSFSQNGPRAVCILTANGAISNVTLRQPAMSGGTVTYEVCQFSSFGHVDLTKAVLYFDFSFQCSTYACLDYDLVIDEVLSVPIFMASEDHRVI